MKSMTAFACQQSHYQESVLQWEIRSVNHRFLDVSFSLPEPLRVLEPPLRELIKTQLKRGKIDCSLRGLAMRNTQSRMEVKREPLQQMAQLYQQVRVDFPEIIAPSFDEVLRWPGLVQTDTSTQKILHDVVLDLFSHTVACLLDSRISEGGKLTALIQQRLEAFTIQLTTVQTLAPDFVRQQKQAWRDRFKQASVVINDERLEQEMLFYAQKIDISEELERLDIHIGAMSACFSREQPVGRRLDFLLQEAHREVNTLAVKSPCARISHAAVEMKLLIEQMREQVQNIE